ncbi:Quinone oxidoreductase-like protein 2 like [Verticillium longisporum]|nr:Quinone oxidoreductase-like protein 2 like [Verticillium longisporum]
MRGIEVKEYVKGPKELKVTDLPDPTPKNDEYLIQVHAAATNFFDILQIQGKYQNQPRMFLTHMSLLSFLRDDISINKFPAFPWVAGAEFAGIVLKTPAGAKSPKFPVGSRVFGATQGAFATKCVAKEVSLLPVPEGWSFQAAAGLFVTAPTSYGALVVRAGIKKGDYVLIHAAAGGVGLAAVQVAKAFGATVIATASTPRKREIALSYGADHAIDTASKDWPQAVKALTPGKRGVDIVYDPVGAVDASTKCTAWNGRILFVGFAAGQIEKVAMNKVLLKNISLVGIHWGQYANHEPQTVGTVWDDIMQLVKDGKMRGTEFSDERYDGLERVPAALTALGSRGTWGKVVVKVPQEGEEKSKL